MFARANAASAASLNPLHSFKAQQPILAIRHIRKLGGSSQALLVEGSDGSFYVVKTSGNPSGPNTLANELLGSVLSDAAGLPIPRVVPISITRDFLDRNPGIGVSTSAGSCSASPGTHFGSCFVGDLNDTSRVIEMLSPSHIPRVVNRECFLGMYLLDIAANHQHYRQAVFVRDGDVFSLKAVFINHGHMFGGPAWNGPTHKCLPLHHNRSLYMSLWHEEDVSAWIAKLKRRTPPRFSEALAVIPKTWFSGDLERVRDTFLLRLDQLSQLASHYRLSEPRLALDVRAHKACDASEVKSGNHTQ